jgi:hypothetical protein
MSGEDRTPEHVNRSELFGPADLVQARDVFGGVHFHADEGSAAQPPRQLPGDVRGFVNRVAELAALDRLLTEDTGPVDVTLSVITGTAGVGKPKPGLRYMVGRTIYAAAWVTVGTATGQRLNIVLPTAAVPGLAESGVAALSGNAERARCRSWAPGRALSAA